jgi:hypothetical protein
MQWLIIKNVFQESLCGRMLPTARPASAIARRSAGCGEADDGGWTADRRQKTEDRRQKTDGRWSHGDGATAQRRACVGPRTTGVPGLQRTAARCAAPGTSGSMTRGLRTALRPGHRGVSCCAAPGIGVWCYRAPGLGANAPRCTAPPTGPGSSSARTTPAATRRAANVLARGNLLARGDGMHAQEATGLTTPRPAWRSSCSVPRSLGRSCASPEIAVSGKISFNRG